MARGKNHYVIDLISDCETLTIAPGFVINHSEEFVQAPGINIENGEFSNLLCGSERVIVIDVNKPRISLVGADCEQSCHPWTNGNFADDSGVFVLKVKCCKNQQTLLPGPWTGRSIIEERCDEFEGHVSYLTREEEVLIQKSCRQTWRGAECVLVQPRICATITGPTVRISECSRKKPVLTFEMLRPDVSLSILLMWSVERVFLARISRRYAVSASL